MYHYDLEKSYTDEYNNTGVGRKLGVAFEDEEEIATLRMMLNHFKMHRHDSSYFSNMDRVVQEPLITQMQKTFLENRQCKESFYVDLEMEDYEIKELLPKLPRLLKLLELCDESLIMVTVSDRKTSDGSAKGRMIKVRDYLDGKIDCNTLQEWRLKNESQQKDSD